MPSETGGQKRARLRGTFTPTPGSGYNRHGRKVLARKLTREGRAELLDAGCDLLEARKEAVNPKRVPVKWLLSRVWKAKAEAKRLKSEAKASMAWQGVRKTGYAPATTIAESIKK